MNEQRETQVNSMELSEENQRVIEKIIGSLKQKPGALLPILHEIQKQLGYIPSSTKPIIAKAVNLSIAEVHGVISFYHFFRSNPPGRYILQVCRAESCQAMGGCALESHIKNTLGVDYHQTTRDGEISLEPVYCLGNCACSPAIRINDEVYGEVNNQQFNSILNELMTQSIKVK